MGYDQKAGDIQYAHQGRITGVGDGATEEVKRCIVGGDHRSFMRPTASPAAVVPLLMR